jgi:putative FmdB family regulatory protein
VSASRPTQIGRRDIVGARTDPRTSRVPTYQYRCTDCDHAFEQFQSFTDDALTVCPECGGRLRKLFNAVGVVFKGSGFYRTDSRGTSSSSEGAASSGDGDSSSEPSSTGSSGSDSSSSTAPKSGSSSDSSSSPAPKSGSSSGSSGTPKTAGATAGS